MKKSLIHISATAFGLSLLVPAFAMAQMNTGTEPMPTRPVEPNVRAEMKAQFMASSTKEKEELRMKFEMRANAAKQLATSTKNIEERIVNAKERAQAEIDRRMKGLGGLLERIAAMKRVSEGFKGDLRATVDAQLENIEALRARIEAGVSSSTLKADIQSITRSYRIFALVMPQAQIAAAADRIVTMTATLSEIGTKLDTRIDAASATGVDVSELTTALQSLSTHIDSANTHAQNAVTGTADLKADEGDTAVAESNRAALQTAREELRLAHEDIKAAREAVATILSGLKGLNGDTEAGATSTTEPVVE